MGWPGMRTQESCRGLDAELSYVTTCEVMGAGGMEGIVDSIYIQRASGCRCYVMLCEDEMQHSTYIRRVFRCRRYVGLT